MAEKTLTPTPKVMAAGAGGAAAMLIVWGVNGFLLTDPAGPQIGPDQATALTTLLTVGAAYFKRD